MDSSVWGESKEVKILWITLLAKKDADGIVSSSLPGLARDAVLSMEECKKAIEILEAPDPYSGTQTKEGRRIEKVEGGWRVINHAKYAEEVAVMRRKNAVRANVRKFRERKAHQNTNDTMERNGFAEVHESTPGTAPPEPDDY